MNPVIKSTVKMVLSVIIKEVEAANPALVPLLDAVNALIQAA